ncbi:MAG: hypothetical protein ACE5G1_11960, partial [bacterium]
KEDKYFGACTMLVTMPGLPMIGHGQIEGFAEKYGMEYNRPYWDETVDLDLVGRHEREIFPLMRKRHVFSDVSHFLLFDFLTPGPGVNENVFAYFNRAGDEAALVAFNNKFEHAAGWIHTSAAYAVRGPDQEISLAKRTLGEALDLHYNENNYCLFRDEITGLEYIRNSKDILERGLYFELGAYKYCVFSGFSEVQDDALRRYHDLEARLLGRGVDSISEALKEILLRPLLTAFESILNPKSVNQVLKQVREKKTSTKDLHDFEIGCLDFLTQAKRFSSGEGDPKLFAKAVSKKLGTALKLPELLDRLSATENDDTAQRFDSLSQDASFAVCLLLGWLLLHQIGRLTDSVDAAEESCKLTTDWLLEKPFAGTLRELGGSEALVADGRVLLRILLREQNWFVDLVQGKPEKHKVLARLFETQDVRHFLEVNQYEEVFWYKKEKLEILVDWLHLIAAIQLSCSSMPKNKRVTALSTVSSMAKTWLAASRTSGYQLEKLLELNA